MTTKKAKNVEELIGEDMEGAQARVLGSSRWIKKEEIAKRLDGKRSR